MQKELLAFTLNEFVKPYLSAEFPGLYFNISCSYETVLAAFSSAFEIGVDIEYRRLDWSGIHIAEHFFSDEEVKSLTILQKYISIRLFSIAGHERKHILKYGEQDWRHH